MSCDDHLRRGAAVQAVALAAFWSATGTAVVAAQPHLALSAGIGRLHQAAACDACGSGPSGSVGVASARIGWPVTSGMDAGLLIQISYSGASAGGQRLHTAALLAGVGTPMRRGGPWGHVAVGRALVPGDCDVTVAGVTARFPAAAPAAGALDHQSPFEIACGHDPRATATVGAGVNVPVGRYAVGPEISVLATTGDRRFTLLTLGFTFRF